MIKEKIPLFKVHMSSEAIDASAKVLASGYIGQGPVVADFENKLTDFLGLEKGLLLTTNSATSAEHLALHLLKGSGSEVLCTPLTCTATNWPVLANNFKIKWVDVDPANFNMDLADLRNKITPETRIIYFVHWGGYPVDLDEVNKICIETDQKYGFRPVVIEDCAHAFGSTYKDKYIGSHGNICTFSFQAIKHLTSVDGGALVLPDKRLYERAKLLRWYGIDRENNSKEYRCEDDVVEWGFKFHMNDVSASIGMANLQNIDKVISRHKDNARYYNESLKNIPGITLLENKSDRESASWIYSLKVDNQKEFVSWMKASSIVVSRVHERNDKHTCVKDYICSLPNLDKIITQMICIPCGWWVTDEQREYIVDSIKRFFKS